MQRSTVPSAGRFPPILASFSTLRNSHRPHPAAGSDISGAMGDGPAPASVLGYPSPPSLRPLSTEPEVGQLAQAGGTQACPPAPPRLTASPPAAARLLQAPHVDPSSREHTPAMEDHQQQQQASPGAFGQRASRLTASRPDVARPDARSPLGGTHVARRQPGRRPGPLEGQRVAGALFPPFHQPLLRDTCVAACCPSRQPTLSSCLIPASWRSSRTTPPRRSRTRCRHRRGSARVRRASPARGVGCSCRRALLCASWSLMMTCRAGRCCRRRPYGPAAAVVVAARWAAAAVAARQAAAAPPRPPRLGPPSCRACCGDRAAAYPQPALTTDSP